jgi:ribosomal protein S18 acetylase RimI-like enzyme
LIFGPHLVGGPVTSNVSTQTVQLRAEYRRPLASDAQSISALIRRTLVPSTLPGWSPVAVEKLLAAAEPRLLCEKFTNAAFAEVCVTAQGPCGFIMATKPSLLNLVVEPASQRHGIGTALLEHLLRHIAATAAEISVLEVNATEYSVAFYRRHAFHPLSEFIEHDGCRFIRMGFWRKSPQLPQS